MSGLIDLSHTIGHGTVTYPGLPAPIICDYLSRETSRSIYAEGVTFQIGRIEMVANTGTYLDSPFHRYEAGMDLADLALDRLANLEAVVVRVPADQRVIDLDLLEGLEVEGRAVLLATGWSRHFETPEYANGHPYLSKRAAAWLAARRPALVGIDSLNIDDTADKARPAHSLLLGQEIALCEHMTNLSALPDRGARFFAVPPKVRGMGTFPVRAFAIVG
jgi:kynurenine formamidase